MSREHFLGCLLGGAVGDALGAPVEFLKRREIVAQFGPKGITSFALAYGRIGAITDDTQMTLFTAEGLLRSAVRGMSRGIQPAFASVTFHAYIRWLLTQQHTPNPAINLDEVRNGWLLDHRALHASRAPGTTCLSALVAAPAAGVRARNNSKGCGGVMRSAPVGLFAARMEHPQTESAFDLAADLAGLTHGHPTGQLASGAFAVIVMALVNGASLDDAVDEARTCLRDRPNHEETLAAIDKAMLLARSEAKPEAAIASLGEGWIAEEALAVALYCARVATTFRDGVILAVNHDGDSDSTGAIAGNLLGAQLGPDVIPADWLEKLELRETISEVASDLFAFDGSSIRGYSPEEISRKYPGV